MRTILVGDCAPERLYQMSDPDAPSEIEFEHAVARGLSCVYSHYRCVVFGGSFLYEGVVRRPDLALVARDFSHWFILEVELVSHSFAGHVLPQVKAFRYGEPQPDCANILARELGIRSDEAETLLQFVPRTVAVVANRRIGSWEIALDAHGIQLVTVAVFKSSAGVEAVEVDGALEVLEENIGFARYSATDRSFRLPRTARLPLGVIQISDPTGTPAAWDVVEAGGLLWVTKVRGAPDIPQGAYVQLLRSVGGRITMRRPSK